MCALCTHATDIRHSVDTAMSFAWIALNWSECKNVDECLCGRLCRYLFAIQLVHSVCVFQYVSLNAMRKLSQQISHAALNFIAFEMNAIVVCGLHHAGNIDVPNISIDANRRQLHLHIVSSFSVQCSFLARRLPTSYIDVWIPKWSYRKPIFFA